MANPRKKRFTITATEAGVERAENALIRLGFNSKANFAESQLISRTTVNKFFQSQPIQLDTFKKICQELTLNWREVAGIEEEKTQQRKKNTKRVLAVDGEVEEMSASSHRKITVIEQKTGKIKAEIKLEGDINSVSNLKILEAILREYSGNTITIQDIQEGSIKLTIEGSPEDIEQLVSLIKSGDLKQIDGFPVEDIQVLSEVSDSKESSELDNKWHLVQEIVNQPKEGRKLRGVDLSDADLNSVNFRYADLSGVNFRYTYLSEANLSEANLKDADLSEANLRGADLRYANLRGADLRGADLGYTDLRYANLRGAIIYNETKINDKWRLVHEIVNQSTQSLNLRYLNLKGANLSEANLRGANFRGANLSDANLKDADLRYADLGYANLSDANLRGANLSDANFRGANLSDANLRGADFSDANLRDANLRYTNLRGTNFRGANFSDANLRGADFSDANLMGANLISTNVENTRFGYDKSISELMKRDLIKRGAIFEDSPEDRSKILTPR